MPICGNKCPLKGFKGEKPDDGLHLATTSRLKKTGTGRLCA